MDDEMEPGREPLWPADDEPAPAPASQRDALPAAPADQWAALLPTPPLWGPETPAPTAPPTLPASSNPAISEAQTARIPSYPQPGAPGAPRSGTPPPTRLDVSEAQTARIPTYPPLPPLAAPRRSVSEEQTARIPTLPPAVSPPIAPSPIAQPPAAPPPARSRRARAASDTPATRLPTEPSLPSLPPLRAAALRSAPPRPAPRPSPPPLPAPLRPPAPKRPLSGPEAARAWAREHWRLVTFTVVALVALIAAGGSYAYASALAAQPQRVVARYCDALVSADYKTAYGLLASATQAQTPLAQYVADGAARDTISGRVTACAGAPGPALSALSFLTNPRAVVISLSMTRASSAQGQIALSRDASGWHVASLSAGVAGVDLGPLHAEQALCSAFMARDYNAAYGLLSAPYQHEQGSEQSFARDFGANLAITGCEPALRGYKLDAAGARASFQMTLDVSVSGGGSSTKLTAPATISLVREQGGWRVDGITPSLSQ